MIGLAEEWGLVELQGRNQPDQLAGVAGAKLAQKPAAGPAMAEIQEHFGPALEAAGFDFADLADS